MIHDMLHHVLNTSVFLETSKLCVADPKIQDDCLVLRGFEEEFF